MPRTRNRLIVDPFVRQVAPQRRADVAIADMRAPCGGAGYAEQHSDDEQRREQRAKVRRQRQYRPEGQREQRHPGCRGGNAAPDGGTTGAVQCQLAARLDQRQLGPRRRRQIVDDIADNLFERDRRRRLWLAVGRIAVAHPAKAGFVGRCGGMGLRLW